MFLFRPEQNGMRMRMGAERMCMPAPSVEHFVEAVKHTTLANKRWVNLSLKIIIYIFFFFKSFINYFIQVESLLIIRKLVQIPPPGKGSLYVRPLLLATGPVLGVAPASEYTFLVYACPVANYFKVNYYIISLCFNQFHLNLHANFGYMYVFLL